MVCNGKSSQFYVMPHIKAAYWIWINYDIRVIWCVLLLSNTTILPFVKTHNIVKMKARSYNITRSWNIFLWITYISSELIFPDSLNSMVKCALWIKHLCPMFSFEIQKLVALPLVHWYERENPLKCKIINWCTNTTPKEGNFEGEHLKKHKQNSMKIKAALNLQTTFLNFEKSHFGKVSKS